MRDQWIVEVATDARNLNLQLVPVPVGDKDLVIRGSQEDLDALMRLIVQRSLPRR